MLFSLGLAQPGRAEKLLGIEGDQDQRVTQEARIWPFAAIGRFNSEAGSYCSGALIGPKLVLTAGHCLWDKHLHAPPPAHMLHFVAGWDRGSYVAHARAASYVISPGFSGARPYSAEEAGRDWALVVLEEPIGEQTGWFGVEPAAEARSTVTLAGYGQDRAQVPAAHQGCHLGPRMIGALMLHDCDAVKGDSGSPLYDAATFRIRAVHVAALQTPQGVAGGAVPTASFLAAARALGAGTAAKIKR